MTATAVSGIDPHTFRQFLLRMTKTAAVVTASNGKVPFGFLVPSFTQVSLRPQLISLGTSQGSLIETSRHFAVHLLAAEQADLARTFTARHVDRFADTSTWRWGPYNLPVLQGVLATLFCESAGRIAVGETVIVLGRPLSGQHRDGTPLLISLGNYLAGFAE